MLMAVYPIHKHCPVEKIVVSTYQAASGAGFSAMQELKNSTKAYLSGEEFKPVQFDYPYSFNLFSHDPGSMEQVITKKNVK